MMNLENISDTEIRVIGGNPQPPKTPFPWRLFAVVVGVIAAIGIIVWWQWPSAPEQPDEPGVFEQEQPVAQPHPLRDWLTSLDTLTAVGTVTKDLTINDIPLRVYAPLNSTPHLEVGYRIADNRNRSILFFQAADVRADNGKIVGAFVLHGKPLSWGLSKRGYCAIIDSQVNGKLVESELKSKAIRRALCDLDDHIVVVESQTIESMHDFAQALVDIGTSNAIYLVGSNAMGWSMDTEGNGTKMGLWDPRKIKNISFIVWSK